MTRAIFFLQAIALVITSVVFFALTPHTSHAATTVSLDSLRPGDLIRGQALPAVYYYGTDGFRYVFPNDKTYFTWYANFDSIKWITDADLGTLQIGGNVTYKPGSRMLKINSDPKTYALGEGGTLHWVMTEVAAVSLYGANWNTKIDDVPDAFFSNYKVGSEISTAGQFDPVAQMTTATSINKDKGLQAAKVIMIQNTGFSPSSLGVDTGEAIRWINKDTTRHSATADNLKWGTGTLQTNQNFARYFKTPGTYTYHDSYSGFTGTIIVE